MKRAFLGVLLTGVLFCGACSIPAWVNTAESDASVLAPIAASLIAVIDPSAATLATLIENGFSALAKTLDMYKASPTATNLQAVEAAFAAVNTNVAQLESAAQIKDTVTQSKVTAIVQLLAQGVTEIAALVPPEVNAKLKLEKAATAPSLVRTPKGLKAKDFKRQFNEIVRGDPEFRPLD